MNTMKKMILAGGIAMNALMGVALAQTYAITNARLEMVGTGATPQTIENGTVVIRNGRISAVGVNPTIPSEAEVLDADGGVVTPGVFAALSGLGLEEISLNREANDRNLRGETPVSASLLAADAIYADSTVIPISRQGGVTRAVSAIDPGAPLWGGCAVMIDLSGSTDPITRRCVAQMVSMGYAGAARTADNRAASIAAFRAAMEDAQAFGRDRFAYTRSVEENRLSSRDAEALQPVLSGDIPLLVQVNGASDIRRVLDLAEQYEIRVVLVGAAEAHRLAEEIAAVRAGVIMNPTSNLPNRFEVLGATLRAAGILADAGVTVAFYDDDIGYTHNVRLLPQLAGNAVANGMAYEDALAAITSNPAELYGVGDRYGRLAPGMTADVVLWNGDPLELSSRAQAMFINGVPTSLDDRQKALAERYQDLSGEDRDLFYPAD